MKNDSKSSNAFDRNLYSSNEIMLYYSRDGLLASPPVLVRTDTFTGALLTMQSNRTDFEAGFALLGIPTDKAHKPVHPTGCAEQFKRVSVLTESNVTYAANCVTLRISPKR